MLTKEERAEIAERFISYDGNKLYFAELFKCLFGREIPRDATTKGSAKTVIDRLIDLCDTSNMVELPLDKDGEVIHINDVIYDNSGEEYQVECIKFFDIGAGVAIRNDDDYTITQPGRITHKNPVTAKSLAQRIKHVLEDEATSIGVNPYVELGRIAEQLESLGDSND
mgnify:CR=1 FL=1